MYAYAFDLKTMRAIRIANWEAFRGFIEISVAESHKFFSKY